MFKKIIFITELLNINNVKCSEEGSSENKKIDEIKSKINSLYTYGKEPFELYKDSKKNIKNYDIKKDKDTVKSVNSAINITDLLEVKIDRNNSYYHYLKTLYLLRLYLLTSLDNINKDVIDVLKKFIWKKYLKGSDEDDNKKKIDEKVEEICLDFIELGLEKLKNKVDDDNFNGFNEKEFDYIGEDIFFQDKKTKKYKAIFYEKGKLNEEEKAKLTEKEKNIFFEKEILNEKEQTMANTLRSIKETCAIKFIISDDLDQSKYFPTHWEETSKLIERQFKSLKEGMYNYAFCNEGIKNVKNNNTINSIENLESKFKIFKKNVKYNEFKEYLDLLSKFNKSLEELKIDESIEFINKLKANLENVIKINDEKVNSKTEYYKIEVYEKEKFKKITKVKNDIDNNLADIKKYFSSFSNNDYDNFSKNYNKLGEINKNYIEKMVQIKTIKSRITLLISDIKNKIDLLNEKNNNIEKTENKIKIPTFLDDVYNEKTEKDLNDIINNLEELEKQQEQNLKKQQEENLKKQQEENLKKQQEEEQEKLNKIKDEEERKKIQDSINLRNSILDEIRKISQEFIDNYNPTENDDKVKIEENLKTKLDECKKIEDYLKDEFNKTHDLLKMLQECLALEKMKVIKDCELKLNEFLEKKKREEEEVRRKADEEDEARRKADEEDEARRKADEENEARRKADDEEETKKKSDENKLTNKQNGESVNEKNRCCSGKCKKDSKGDKKKADESKKKYICYKDNKNKSI